MRMRCLSSSFGMVPSGSILMVYSYTRSMFLALVVRRDGPVRHALHNRLRSDAADMKPVQLFTDYPAHDPLKILRVHPAMLASLDPCLWVESLESRPGSIGLSEQAQHCRFNAR